MEELEERLAEYIDSLRELPKRHRSPGAVICAELDLIPDWKSARSQRTAPTPLASQLRNRLLSIGPLNSIVNGNPVGGCAEVHASSPLLIQDEINFDVEHIRFSRAIRPRTGEEKVMCSNCQSVFT